MSQMNPEKPKPVRIRVTDAQDARIRELAKKTYRSANKVGQAVIDYGLPVAEKELK